MTRNGTPMQRLRDRQRVSAPPERIAYARERGQEQIAEQAAVEAAAASDAADAAAAVAADAAADAADALDDAADALLAADEIVDGTTAFTALNMAGTDVAPFLAKTDGSKLIDSSGLDNEVVVTAALADEAVTTPDEAFTSASMSIAGSADVEIQSLTVAVGAGERVELLGSAAIEALGKNGSLGQLMGHVSIKLKRDATTIYEAKCAPVVHGILIPVLATAPYYDTPSAGTHTYTLCTSLSEAGDTSSAVAEKRRLAATRVKR